MQGEWQRVTPGKLLGFLSILMVLVLLILRSEPGFVLLLDHANLLFHEAGHPLVGLISSRLEPYGGTIGQLAFPVVVVASFWRKREPAGVAAGGLWFCENLFNIARYMADARALQLPLVGGGDHDWNTILSRWNLLQYDTRLAEYLRAVAWLGLGVVTAWFAWRAWRDRARVAAHSDAFQPL